MLAKLRHPWAALWAVLFLIAAGILTYALTMAFVWDEGFHLVAAQLIAWGRTPYIDFAFPQTLLNAYFNAAVLRILGPSWRAVQFFDAMFAITTVCLAADYVMRRFPAPSWRLPCAIVVACSVGLNTVVIPFGPIAQAYGSGMLLAFAAFRVTVARIAVPRLWLVFCTALLAGAAAGSTLLTAPLIPVLLIWLLIENHASSRIATFATFCAGVLIPFAPEIWLLLKAPQVTFFNVVQYQALFRRVNWGDVGAHDFDVLTDWTVSSQTLLLGLFAIVGLLFIARRSDWERQVRREFYLAASIALALGLYISTAHPTFGRYFVFMIPFVAVVSSAGFYYIAGQLVSLERPWWPVAIVVFIVAMSAAKYVFDDRESTHWSDYEAIAAKIKEVTPAGKEYMADEMVYFLLHEAPPSGLEFSYSHKIQLPPAQEALYHVISLAELKKQVAHGRFATLETCKDEVIDDFELNKYYPNKEEFDDCTVFWRNTGGKK